MDDNSGRSIRILMVQIITAGVSEHTVANKQYCGITKCLRRKEGIDRSGGLWLMYIVHYCGIAKYVLIKEKRNIGGE